MLRSKDRTTGTPAEVQRPESAAAPVAERLKPPPPPLPRNAAPAQPEQALARHSFDLLGLNVTPPEPWPSNAAEPRVDDWLPPLPDQGGGRHASESPRPRATTSRSAAEHSQAGAAKAGAQLFARRSQRDTAPQPRDPQGAFGADAESQAGAAAEWDAYEPASQTRQSVVPRQPLLQGVQPTKERTRTTPARAQQPRRAPDKLEDTLHGLNAPLTELLPAPREPARPSSTIASHVGRTRAAPQPSDAAGAEPLARRGRATQAQAGASLPAQAVHSTQARAEQTRAAESQGSVLEGPLARRGRASHAQARPSQAAQSTQASSALRVPKPAGVEATQQLHSLAPKLEPLARRGRTSRPPHVAQPATLPAVRSGEPLPRDAEPHAPRTRLEQAQSHLRAQSARPESRPALGMTSQQPHSRTPDSARTPRAPSRPPHVESRTERSRPVETLQPARAPSRPAQVESRAERSRPVETLQPARALSRPAQVESRAERSQTLQPARAPSRPAQEESRTERSRPVETLPPARVQSRPPVVMNGPQAERSGAAEAVDASDGASASLAQSRFVKAEQGQSRPLGIELPVLQPGPGGAGPLRLRDAEGSSSRSQRAAARDLEALSGALRFQPQEHTPADGYRRDSRQATELLPATLARRAPWPHWAKAALAGVALGAAASVAVGYSAAWLPLLQRDEPIPVLLTAAPSDDGDAPQSTGALAPSTADVPSLRPLATSSTPRLQDGAGLANAPAATSGSRVPLAAERRSNIATTETSANAATSALVAASPEPARPPQQTSEPTLRGRAQAHVRTTKSAESKAQAALAAQADSQEEGRAGDTLDHAALAAPEHPQKQERAGQTDAALAASAELQAQERAGRPSGSASLTQVATTAAPTPEPAETSGVPGIPEVPASAQALEAAARAPSSSAPRSAALSTLDQVLAPARPAPQAAAAPEPTNVPPEERPVLSIKPLDPASSGLPAQPTREQVRDVMLAMHSQLAQCARDKHGTTFANVTIQGSGRVSYSLIEGAFAGTEAGSCMARVLRAATFPEFLGPPFKVRYPLQF